jgi:hypothetical protein
MMKLPCHARGAGEMERVQAMNLNQKEVKLEVTLKQVPDLLTNLSEAFNRWAAPYFPSKSL